MAKIRVIKIVDVVTLVGCETVRLESMEDMMAKHLGDEQRNAVRVVSITIDSLYAFYMDGKWRRLKVTKLDGYTVKGYFPDYGRFHTTTRNSLRFLPESLQQIPPCVQMYRVTGLVPMAMVVYENSQARLPDDLMKSSTRPASKWTETAFQFVSNILKKCPYVELVDSRKSKSGYIYCSTVMVMQEAAEVSLKQLLVNNNFAAIKEDGSDTASSEVSSHRIPQDFITDTASSEVSNHRIPQDFITDTDSSMFSDPKRSPAQSHLDVLSLNKSAAPNKLMQLLPPANNASAVEDLTTIGMETLDGALLEMRVLVLGSGVPKPVLSYKESRVAPVIQKCLVGCRTTTFLYIQTYMLPCIMRDRDVLALAPPNKGKTTGLIMSLVSRLVDTDFRTDMDDSFPNIHGPLALLITPSWTKAKKCADYVTKFLQHMPREGVKHVTRMLCAYGSNTSFLDVKLSEGCELLIATPPCIVRLLKKNQLADLRRLSILALDDADTLTEGFKEDLIELLLFYKQATSSKLHTQIVSTATEWTPGLESFLKYEMNQPISIFTSRQEAAIRVGLKNFIIDLSQEMDELAKLEELDSLLEKIQSSLHRVVIVSKDESQVTRLYKYLFRTHTNKNTVVINYPNSVDEAGIIQQMWHSWDKPGQKPLLVLCDRGMDIQKIAISNADIIIHWDVSSSYFQHRLFLLKDSMATFKDAPRQRVAPSPSPAAFPHVAPKSCPENGAAPKSTVENGAAPKPIDTQAPTENSVDSKPIVENGAAPKPTAISGKSFFLLRPCDVDGDAADGLVRYLTRSGVKPPIWMVSIAAQHKVTTELHKKTNDLCSLLKSYGACEQIPACKYRHIIFPELDKSVLPICGDIKFRMLNFITSSRFFVRILEHTSPDKEVTNHSTEYEELLMQMNDCFTLPENHTGVKDQDVVAGLIAAVLTPNYRFHRVRVIQVEARSSALAKVIYIDMGITAKIPKTSLLALPSHLKAVQPQAIEMIVAGLKPADNDPEFTKESKKFAEELLKDKVLYAKILLSLGGTIWVDDAYQLVFHKHTQIKVYDQALKVQLLHHHLALPNPSHMDHLYSLCAGKIDVIRTRQESSFVTRRFTYKHTPMKSATLDEHGLTKCLIGTNYTPNRFYLVRDDAWDTICSLESEITALIVSIRSYPPEDLSPESLCLVPVGDEEGGVTWHRACILAVDGEQCEAFLVDIGEEVTLNVDLIRKLPVEYKQLPMQAIRCSLANCVSRDDVWPDDVTALLDDFCFNEIDARFTLEVRLVCRTVEDGVHPQHLVEVRRWQDRTDLCETLVQSGAGMASNEMAYWLFPEAREKRMPLFANSSIPHLAFQLFVAKDGDLRTKFSLRIETLAVRQSLNGKQDQVVTILVNLIKFVPDLEHFIPLCRALAKIANDPDYKQIENNLIPLDPLLPPLLLNHLRQTISSTDPLTDSTLDTALVLVDLLRALCTDISHRELLVKSCGDDWVHLMDQVLKVVPETHECFGMVLDLCELVVVVTHSHKSCDVLLRMCCRVMRNSDDVNLWTKAILVLSIVIDKRLARMACKEEELPNLLWDRIMGSYLDKKEFTDFHNVAVDLLQKMWAGPYISRKEFVRRNSPSHLKEVLKSAKDPAMIKWYCELLTEVSSLPSIQPRMDLPPENSHFRRVKTYHPTVLEEPLPIDGVINHPDVEWYERRKNLFLIVHVANSRQTKKCPLSINNNKLIQFRHTTIDNVTYAFDIDLHDRVIADKSEVKCNESSVTIRLRKVTPQLWYRIQPQGFPGFYLRKNMDHLNVNLTDSDSQLSSSSSETSTNPRSAHYRPTTSFCGEGETLAKGGPPEEDLNGDGSSDGSSMITSSDSDRDLDGTRGGNPAEEDVTSNYFNL